MYCKNCGNELTAETKFCPSCGKPVDVQPLIEKQKQNRAIAVISLVLGVLGLGAWLIPLVGFPIAIAGLVLGIIGIKKSSKKLAVVGVILASLSLLATVANAAIGAYMGYNGQIWFQQNTTSNEDASYQNQSTSALSDENIPGDKHETNSSSIDESNFNYEWYVDKFYRGSENSNNIMWIDDRFEAERNEITINGTTSVIAPFNKNDVEFNEDSYGFFAHYSYEWTGANGMPQIVTIDYYPGMDGVLLFMSASPYTGKAYDYSDLYFYDEEYSAVHAPRIREMREEHSGKRNSRTTRNYSISDYQKYENVAYSKHQFEIRVFEDNDAQESYKLEFNNGKEYWLEFNNSSTEGDEYDILLAGDTVGKATIYYDEPLINIEINGVDFSGAYIQLPDSEEGENYITQKSGSTEYLPYELAGEYHSLTDKSDYFYLSMYTDEVTINDEVGYFETRDGSYAVIWTGVNRYVIPEMDDCVMYINDSLGDIVVELWYNDAFFCAYKIVEHYQS